MGRSADVPEAVWAFGSMARGELSVDSDVDILVLADEEEDVPPAETIRMNFALPRTPDVSHYTRGGILALVSPPSLFAWHLRDEGQPLLDRTGWLSMALGGMRAYHAHAKDLRTMWRLLGEAVDSLQTDSLAVAFDTATLGVVARNVALIVSHLDGEPDYSPRAPVRLIGHRGVGFPLSREEYELLLSARYAAERGGKAAAVQPNQARSMAARLQEWLRGVVSYADARRA